MTCERCAALEEKIAYLERELGVRRADHERAALVARLGVSPTQAVIMLALYRGGGKIVNHGLLVDLLPQGGDAASLKVHVSRLRQVVGEDAVTNTYGAGYALTPKGLSMVLACLEPVEIQPERQA